MNMDNLTTITTDLIKRHMGRAATTVYLHLLQHANGGVYKLRRKAISEDVEVSLSSVKDAIKKLVSVGLIKVNPSVEVGRGFTAYTVVGKAPLNGTAVDVVAMPQDVANAIMSRPTHGGPRKGAGRPKGAKNKPKTETVDEGSD